ncbi:SGNH/GDSL hydrolase family protein [Pseudorhodoferax sp.]|uniref:SGNH/GDSL hydrolase family protein n=1 Tax=Pseudorhodoferax sp. TaxID=1993553 RepID=UPI002DD63682|nr:SGNH/GDSL hydrolase family protein [Pseudorhodoferax sp.]
MLAAAKLVLLPLLLAQGVMTRARLPRLPEADGERAGVAAPGGLQGQHPLRLLVAGDSSAAGVGVRWQHEALAAPLAARLAAYTGRPVPWALQARTGLSTAELLAWLQQEPPATADLAMVVSGVNDVTGRVRPAQAVAARDALATLLRRRGVRHIAFAPLPPMHAFPGLPQPLRWVAGAEARRHNQALAAWVATRDDVSCVPLQLPLARDGVAADGFHPGAPLYRLCADVMASHLAAFEET